MERLREILRERGTDISKLSARTGISVERIRALESETEPTVGELRRLADALKVSILDFATLSSAEREVDVLFRKAPVAGKAVPSGAVSGLSRKMASSFELLPSVRDSNVPWWWSSFEHAEDSLESAERNAIAFRRVFCSGDQLSPLHSLPKIVTERMGAMLFVLRSTDLDGASAFFDGIPFIFVSARFPPRMLFTLAHECGHIVAHHDPSEHFAVIDETTDNEGVGAPKRAEERYADAFASALLLPRASVGLTLKKVREVARIAGDEIGDLEIGYLARIFGVSFWAAARRCEDLDLLPRGSAASLNERLAAEYGSAEKRADQAGLPPRVAVTFPPVPRAILESAIEKIRAGELSIGRAATVLGMSISDLMASNAPTAH